MKKKERVIAMSTCQHKSRDLITYCGHMPPSVEFKSLFPSLSPIAMPEQDQTQSITRSAQARPVPSGFTYLRGPDDREYLVPDFFVAQTMFAWDHDKMMQALDVNSASRAVRFFRSKPRILSYSSMTSQKTPKTNPLCCSQRPRSRTRRTRYLAVIFIPFRI